MERDKKDAAERQPREDQADKGGSGEDTIFQPVPEPTETRTTPRQGTRER